MVDDYTLQGLLIFILSALIILKNKILKNLIKAINKKLSDYLLEKIMVVFSLFKRKYFRELANEYRTLHIEGLGKYGSSMIPMEDIYIELFVYEQHPKEICYNLINQSETNKQITIWDIIERKNDNCSNYILVGSPGSGKSTLLRHIVFETTKRRKKITSNQSASLIPIILPLRDQNKKIMVATPPTLPELLNEIYRHLEPPKKWFNTMLIKKKCIILLDGLDETPDSQARMVIRNWIKKQITIYHGNIFIVTSRPYEYFSNPISNTIILEIKSFNLKQIKLFIHNWHQATSTNKESAQFVSELTDYIFKNENIMDLAANPLLLTIILMVHNINQGELPKNRIDLYKEMELVFLETWQREKGNSQPFRTKKIRFIIEKIAYSMISRGIYEISISDVSKIVKTCFSDLSIKQTEPEEWLYKLSRTSGIFFEKDVDIFSFAHKTFTEYYTASYIINMNLESRLIISITDPFWQEIIRFYILITDSENIIKLYLKGTNTNIDTLSFLFECLCEKEIIHDSKLPSLLLKKIFQGIDSDDEIVFKKTVDVLLFLRCKLDFESGIGKSYVTNAEYFRFIKECSSDLVNYYPDHWISKKFPTGFALQPVVGVRFQDAISFSRWLTDYYNITNAKQISIGLISAKNLETASKYNDSSGIDLPISFNDGGMGEWLNDGTFHRQLTVHNEISSLFFEYTHLLFMVDYALPRLCDINNAYSSHKPYKGYSEDWNYKIEKRQRSYIERYYSLLKTGHRLLISVFTALIPKYDIDNLKDFKLQWNLCNYSQPDLNEWKNIMVRYLYLLYENISFTDASQLVESFKEHRLSKNQISSEVDYDALLYSLEKYSYNILVNPLDIESLHHTDPLTNWNDDIFLRLKTRKTLISHTELDEMRIKTNSQVISYLQQNRREEFTSSLKLYCFIVHMKERVKGNLPAWEGIKLIRKY